jgi:hypothetical protein
MRHAPPPSDGALEPTFDKAMIFIEILEKAVGVLGQLIREFPFYFKMGSIARHLHHQAPLYCIFQEQSITNLQPCISDS